MAVHHRLPCRHPYIEPDIVPRRRKPRLDHIFTSINQRDQSHPLFRSHREKIQREAFDQYLVYKTFEKNQATDLAAIPIEIEHADSKNEPCIQAADFIAGALHYYYRTDDDTFSGIINEKVTLAFDYFKGPQK